MTIRLKYALLVVPVPPKDGTGSAWFRATRAGQSPPAPPRTSRGLPWEAATPRQGRDLDAAHPPVAHPAIQPPSRPAAQLDTAAATHLSPGGPAAWIQATGAGGDQETFTGDIAIITVPFSAFRHVTVAPPLSYRKRRAVIELHYDSSTKVLLEFSRRWWEFTEDDWNRELEAIEPGLYRHYQSASAARTDGQRTARSLLGADPAIGTIPADQRAAYAKHPKRTAPVRPATHVFGGGSVTDNPNRFIYYPAHPVPGSSGGVVLASYTWADDAARWDSMNPAERYIHALSGLQDVHGDRIEVFYTGHGQTQSWLEDHDAFGEAAVLNPGQLTHLHPHIPTAEGPLHFADEHTSLKHSWIEGALESAVRTALEVNTR